MNSELFQCEAAGPGVICIVESWLDSDIFYYEIELSG